MQRPVRGRHPVVVHVAPVAADLRADLEAVELDPARVQHLARRDPRRARLRSRRRARSPVPRVPYLSSATDHRASARSARTGRPCGRARPATAPPGRRGRARPAAAARRSRRPRRARPRAGPPPSPSSRRRRGRGGSRARARSCSASAATKPTSATTIQAAASRVVELRQHDERLRLHRAADEHRARRPTISASSGATSPTVGLRGAVEDDAHRAVVVVLGDQDDRAGEVRDRRAPARRSAAFRAASPRRSGHGSDSARSLTSMTAMIHDVGRGRFRAEVVERSREVPGRRRLLGRVVRPLPPARPGARGGGRQARRARSSWRRSTSTRTSRSRRASASRGSPR